MRRPDDPLDRLRRANPVRVEDRPGPESPEGRAILERIVGAPTQEPPRQHRRRPPVLLAAVLTLFALAAAYTLVREVQEPLFVACFSEADLRANRAILTSGPGRAQEVCRQLWEPGGEFATPGRRPPSLAVCVLDRGLIAAFPRVPGRDTCAELGLAQPERDPARQEEHRPVQELQEHLSETFLDRCLGEEDATAMVRQELHRLGLADWQVEVAPPFTEERPCASLAIEASTKTVRLVPLPAGS